MQRKQGEKEAKERREREKGAFAQYLPDYSFRRPAGVHRWQEGETAKERGGEKDTGTIDRRGYVHICKYIYPGSTGSES